LLLLINATDLSGRRTTSTGLALTIAWSEEEALMSKKLLTAASFALGGAGVVLVGYLSANPRAFTHPVADLPFQSETKAAIVEPKTPVQPASTLVLPEVTISAAIRKPATAKPRSLEPCSDWTEIGATIITAQGATGLRQVRNLCNRPTSSAGGS
jgi:hypothetical protein